MASNGGFKFSGSTLGLRMGPRNRYGKPVATKTAFHRLPLTEK